MKDIDPNIIRVCDAYTQAIYKKDVKRFLDLYHPQARVFDTWQMWSYEGVGARSKIIEEWFTSLGNENVRVTFDRVKSTVSLELAVVSARVIYVALSAAGEELRSMQNRLTWVLKFEEGAWKIIHEHTSVPIGFNDLKGLLQPE